MTTRVAVTRNSEIPRRAYPSSPFRMFEDLFNDWAYHSLEGTTPEGWRPAADILEQDNNLVLRLELPGVAEKEVELKVEGSVLMVRGSKKPIEGADNSHFHQVESRFGDFSRSFALPDTVDVDQISAGFKNGVLTITLPSKPESKPRTIRINA